MDPQFLSHRSPEGHDVAPPGQARDARRTAARRKEQPVYPRRRLHRVHHSERPGLRSGGALFRVSALPHSPENPRTNPIQLGAILAVRTKHGGSGQNEKSSPERSTGRLSDGAGGIALFAIFAASANHGAGRRTFQEGYAQG